MKTKKRVGYHHGDLKGALVAAAIKHMQKEGSEPSLRELASGEGVSHAAAYRHFPSKRHLLAAVAEVGFAKLKDCMEKGEKSGFSLQELGEVYVEFAMGHPAHFRAMFHADLADKDEFPSLQKVSEESFRVVVRSVAKGMKTAKEDKVLLHALTAWSVVHGMASLFLNQQFNESKKALGLAPGVLTKRLCKISVDGLLT